MSAVFYDHFDANGWTYYTAGSVEVVRDEHGPYKVGIHCPHVAFGKRYEYVYGRAVHDDFGSLVMVADDQGQLTLL